MTRQEGVQCAGSRITSYNVCYTKLLRKSRVRFEFSKAGTARFIPHLDLMEIVKRAMRMSDFPMAFTQGFNKREKISAGYRITSYNVCYTKLLRFGAVFPF